MADHVTTSGAVRPADQAGPGPEPSVDGAPLSAPCSHLAAPPRRRTCW